MHLKYLGICEISSVLQLPEPNIQMLTITVKFTRFRKFQHAFNVFSLFFKSRAFIPEDGRFARNMQHF